MRRVSDSQTVVAVTPTRRMRRPRFDEERRKEDEPPSLPERAPRNDSAEDDGDPPPLGTHVDEFA